jgi:hypothetical protein
LDSDHAGQADQAERRRIGVRVLAGYLAAGRCSPGDPQWPSVLAECMAEADSGLDAEIALADAAPPMDPELRRRVRRLLREASRKAAEGPQS